MWLVVNMFACKYVCVYVCLFVFCLCPVAGRYDDLNYCCLFISVCTHSLLLLVQTISECTCGRFLKVR